MGTVYVVANQKGGVGKTTTAVNIAAYAAMSEEKTLLIDADPQGNATSGLGLRKETITRSIYDLLLDSDVTASDTIQPSPYAHLDILPANRDLLGAESQLVRIEGFQYRLKEKLLPIKDSYRHIIIDCPPSLGALTVNSLVAADRVIIPIQCEYYALEGMSQLLNTIMAIQKSLNPNLEIARVVMTMHDGRTNLAQQVVNEVRLYFGPKVSNVIVPRNVRLSEAPSFGQPIGLYDPKSKGAEAYARLAMEVLGIGKERSGERSRSLDPRNWFGGNRAGG
ncbi:MAG: ParA family protein [Armatimonadetes bacterium]|nr:ParA family protein [Armatimonadota bacterium]